MAKRYLIIAAAFFSLAAGTVTVSPFARLFLSVFIR